MEDLRRRVVEFRDRRDWKQFHTPKDLAISISLEAAELLEHFQWKGPAEVAAHLAAGEGRAEVAGEMADLLILLISLADVVGVDLHQAALDKLAANEGKYPIEQAKGTAKKYDELSR